MVDLSKSDEEDLVEHKFKKYRNNAHEGLGKAKWNLESKLSYWVGVLSTNKCNLCDGHGHSSLHNCPTLTSIKDLPSWKSWMGPGFSSIKHLTLTLDSDYEMKKEWYTALFGPATWKDAEDA